jgi:hypothetical protein
METQVRTPQAVFMQPQRLIVPLFQRPYVWNEENQWEPLWKDMARMAEKLVAQPGTKHYPHFLGAVVLQQVQNASGTMQERIVIDGQQRLTTLQLLFDALHSQLVAVNAEAAALRMETLVVNASPFCRKPEDRFKVWPTNRDRSAFNEVMAAPIPTDYSTLKHKNERMVQAHQFFSARAAEWLAIKGPDFIQSRAIAIETAARELLQMVVIDLSAEENAQEIFETLNARGSQLTAADLIKNFIFQQLLEEGSDVEKLYEKHWKDFETAFWETEIAFGRLRYPRSSVFLNHWLVAQTGEEVVAREVFSRFKSYSTETHSGMETLLGKLDRAAAVYRKFIESGSFANSQLNRLQLFAYRTGVLESEVVKPLVLFLYDPEQTEIPAKQIEKALAVVESWMVRRMLVRATTKSYTQLVAEVIRHLQEDGKRKVAGDSVEAFLASQTSDSRYWPDDQEIRDTLRYLPAYRRLQRGRLRMVLEGIEDHLRGWKLGKEGKGGEQVTKAKFAIEHIMPRKWQTYWKHPDGPKGEVEREVLIHTLGNLTLLTSSLNSKVSNGPWSGDSGKRKALEAHDVLFLNRRFSETSCENWTDASVRQRTDELSKIIVEIWPVLEGHRSPQGAQQTHYSHRVDLSDLISAGWLQPGTVLYPRQKKFADTTATLLSDGSLDVGGKIYSSPSDAAGAIVGSVRNGWWFFLVDPQEKKDLRKVRSAYLESISADGEEDDIGDEDEE